MRVLVAPQEFKGSLAADEAALAIARGIRRARPEWQLDVLPLADGGPGFLNAMRLALRGDVRAIVTHDALGRRVVGRYLWLPRTSSALVEAAQANGLLHVAPEERDALAADTFGVGELILAAVEDGPRQLLIGVGGSATTDGGAGMARALGARLLDAAGNDLPPGGGGLRGLARIAWEPPDWAETTDIVVASDVTNPLLGPNGAAAVYGPQKGASPADVDTLEAALANYARVVEECLGVDIRSFPAGGAAGGLAAGLVAFLGARIVSGFDVVAEATNLAGRVANADLVATGEGSFDSQSSQGKTTGRLLELAAHLDRHAVVFAGRASAPASNLRTLVSLEPDPARAMANASDLLATLAQQWAAAIDA